MKCFSKIDVWECLTLKLNQTFVFLPFCTYQCANQPSCKDTGIFICVFIWREIV